MTGAPPHPDQPADLVLRPGTPADVAGLVSLGAHDRDAWGATQFAEEFVLPLSRTLVAQSQQGADAAVVGGIVCWYVADELHILTLVVQRGRRRLGVGRMLLTAALAAAAANGLAWAMLEVSADNGPAQALYRGLGFVLTGRRRSYYRGSGADALTLRRRLAAAPGNRGHR